MNDLFRIHTFYKYSLSAFLVVVARAINMITEGRLHFDNIPGQDKPEEEEGAEQEDTPE